VAEQQWYGVVTADDLTQPKAMFLDANQALEYRRRTFGQAGLVVPLGDDKSVPPDLEESFRSLAPLPPAPRLDPHAELKAGLRVSIRQQIVREALEKDVRVEVEEQMRQEKELEEAETAQRGLFEDYQSELATLHAGRLAQPAGDKIEGNAGDKVPEAQVAARMAANTEIGMTERTQSTPQQQQQNPPPNARPATRIQQRVEQRPTQPPPPPPSRTPTRE
jgi:hypothetical protein